MEIIFHATESSESEVYAPKETNPMRFYENTRPSSSSKCLLLFPAHAAVFVI